MLKISDAKECKKIISQYNEFEELVLEKLDRYTEIRRSYSSMGIIEKISLDSDTIIITICDTYDDNERCVYKMPIEFLYDPMFPSIYRIPFDKEFKKKAEEANIRALMKQDTRERKEYERLRAKFEGVE